MKSHTIYNLQFLEIGDKWSLKIVQNDTLFYVSI